MVKDKVKFEKQKKWSEKNDYISKSYKLKRKVVEKFAWACNIKEVTYSKKLQELMEKYISEVEKEVVNEDEQGESASV